MDYTFLQSLIDAPGLILAHVGRVYAHAFFAFNKPFTIPALICALIVVLVFVGVSRRRRNRPIKLKVLVRAIFPRRILSNRSTKADVGFFFLNTLLITGFIGWAALSSHQVSSAVQQLLATTFGTPQSTTLGPVTVTMIVTLAMFLAAEFGYFIDHYLAHKIPFLWEFHKVHHSAEVLTPLTNFRVHPVDTLVYYNILALVMGLTGGLLDWSLGRHAQPFTYFNVNVFILIWLHTLGELQHSHFWIAFTGRLGHIFMSPAHHQIHHSSNPIHFDRNMGNSLGIFDWLFGTLWVPGKIREKLVFGVEANQADPNNVTACLIEPVGAALKHLLPKASAPQPIAAGEAAGDTSLAS